MVTIIEKNDKFVFEMNVLHQILTLTSKVVVEKSHIIRAYQNRDELSSWKGLRVGTSIPFVLHAGTFFIDGERNFWDVIDKSKTIIVELKDDVYGKLYIEVDDPAAAVNLLNHANE